ncbi:MAG: ABC transporter ATP-binding protein, partial [Finegoldia magna]
MNAVTIKNLNFGYNEDLVLKDLNLKINQGEMALILGGNGSGKSTLLKLMLGELKADDGEIKVLDKNIKDYKSYR